MTSTLTKNNNRIQPFIEQIFMHSLTIKFNYRGMFYIRIFKFLILSTDYLKVYFFFCMKNNIFY